jgi:hypothetical protein
MDRGLHACPPQKTKFLSFKIICWKGHVTWIRPFFVFGKRNCEMPNIPWLEFFHFQLLQILVPSFTSFGCNLDIYFSQTMQSTWQNSLSLYGEHLYMLECPSWKRGGWVLLKSGRDLTPNHKGCYIYN